MENNPELVAAGVLLAAAILFAFRMSFRLWTKGHTLLAIVLGLPPFLYGAGLLAAALGFGTF